MLCVCVAFSSGTRTFSTMFNIRINNGNLWFILNVMEVVGTFIPLTVILDINFSTVFLKQLEKVFTAEHTQCYHLYTLNFYLSLNVWLCSLAYIKGHCNASL